MIFYFKKEQGKVLWNNKLQIQDYIKHLKDDHYQMEIIRERKDVTKDQRAYYFSCVVSMLGNHLGYTKEDMDYELRRMFLRDPTSQVGRIKSLSDSGISREEMATFIDKCILFASNEGVIVPEANKEWKK